MSPAIEIEPSESVVPGRHARRLPDGQIECEVCPRRCRLSPGQRGLCFVRGRLGDNVVLTTYGRSSGFCIDPIEKKPLNHFLPGTPVLSFGTAGCNLSCRFCQNWDISKSRELDTLQAEASPETIARAAWDLGCRSVAFTYNDPVIFLEYAVDTAIACREQDIRSVAVTAGYVTPEARADFFGAMDATNVDLKAFSEAFYRNVCAAELAPVLDTLVYLRHETDVWLEITTLLVPDENDSQRELEAMAAWVVESLGPDIPWHFSAFHPDFKMTNKVATPRDTLERARRIALEAGVHHVYTGNVHDPAGQSSYCSGCGAIVIGRSGYVLSTWNLDADGSCTGCGQRCPGVFEATPGNWGARRVPVRPSDYAR